MLNLFIRDNARRVQSAVAAANDGDASTLREEVHALKGSAALLGADALRDLAGDIEMRILSGTIPDPHPPALQLSAEYDAVVSTLKALYPELCAG
jgi:HPt (histidine-containing phosphotransfer) domain-containing protein